LADLRDILKGKGIYFRETNNPAEIIIQCTSGEHTDKNPSLSFNMDKNVFHCFSCGFGGGTIKFLQSIGITEKLHIESKQEYKIIKLQRKLRALKNIGNLQLPRATNDVTWDFNGVSANTLQEFGAFTTAEYGLDDYICIPVYLFGRLKFIDARIRHSGTRKPKYNRRPEGISVADVLFPVDKIDNTNEVVLVEGMYDMLNLWEKGITNCLCIFGTQNFNKKKIELLDKIGIHKVILMMDGDIAGRNATTKIKGLLDYNNILSKEIYLPEGIDPGNISKEYLYELLGIEEEIE
jgi:5S rRNA maturation endonuclease (ribonuclease M5)